VTLLSTFTALRTSSSSAKKPKEHAKVHISWQEQDDRRVRAARRHGGRELLHGRRGLGSLSGVGRKGEELPHGGGVVHDATNAATAAGGGDCYSHCGAGGRASTQVGGHLSGGRVRGI
jgi:hypothetical protein